MDIFAHGLWTNAIYGGIQKRKRTWREVVEIVFWGGVPDFFSFGVLAVYDLFSAGYVWRGKAYYLAHTPQWLYSLHRILYSLPLFFLVFFLIWVFRRKAYWPIGGWFMHIVIDIFTHKNFFPPHFLWPFYPSFYAEGVPWSTPIFMIINYAAIAAVYGYWYFVMRKKENRVE